ncbi:MAG TPA: Lpg1974 family pore-forming outer membrane protein [Chlamydiales bacterium]|nr:Lpg1974 family pore-forming outer membrane protein [Chlamydiales bacterium]
MNKIFLSLAVSLITVLSAETPACPQKSCEPCCPKPKPPICCECYVPSYNDLQCDAGLFIYGDFLYWFAKEDNLSPCMTVIGVPNVSSSNNSTYGAVKANHFDTKWDPGFRAGLGYNLPHDGWDIDANYTWYRNKKHQKFGVPPFGTVGAPNFPAPGQLALIDPWNNFAVSNVGGGVLENPGFDTVQSLWKLTFNQVDLDLGRKFRLSEYMAMRSYIGARGAWFTTRFNNIASSNALFSTNFIFNSFSDKFKDKIWGVGLLGGLQPEWHFSRNFILFSNLDAALLWGKFRLRKNEDYTSFSSAGVETITFHNTLTSDFFKLQAVLDVTAGFRWEQTWCYRVRTSLDIGWEYHIWFDVNNRIKYGALFGYGAGSGNDIGFSGYEELQGNLMISGGVVRFRVDF